MEQLTQEQLDLVVDEFVCEINRQIDESGRSLAMTLATGTNKDVIRSFVMYQEEIIPMASSLGLQAKSLSELFGMEIKLTVVDA